MTWSSTSWNDFTEQEIAAATEDPGVICVSLGEKGGPSYFTYGPNIRTALRRFWVSSEQSIQFRNVARFSSKVMPVAAAQTTH